MESNIDIDHKYYQGIGCARPDLPGVYARVSGAIDWIEKQICDLSSNPPAGCLNHGGCGQGTIRIDIYYDDHPSEISWSIEDRSTGVVIAESDSIDEDDVLVSTYVKLDNGIYDFVLEDSDVEDSVGKSIT